MSSPGESLREKGRTVLFGLFEFHPSTLELKRAGRSVRLQELPARLLAALLRNPGELVTREQLRAELWASHTYVQFDAGLNTAMNKLRLALRDSAENPRFIRTVPRYGYQFIAPVRPAEPQAAQLQPMDKAGPGPSETGGTMPSREPAPAEIRASRPRKAWVRFLAAVIVTAVATALLSWRLRPFSPQLPLVASTLTSYPGMQSHPALSPDGSEVAFDWADSDTAVRHIYVVPLRGGDPHPLTSGAVADSFPEWSPDGTQIAFLRGYESLMIASRRGGERRLGSAYLTGLSWSPDGHWIAHGDWTADHRRTAIFETDPVTGVSRQLTTPGLAPAFDISPAFSPDGKRLAFARCYSSDTCSIFSMPAEGGAARILTQNGCNSSGITWDPDGRSVIASCQRSGRRQLWRIDASGSGRQELILAAGEHARFPKLGRGPGARGKIVYEDRLMQSNIWRLDAPRRPEAPFGPPRRIVVSTSRDSSPKLSPDGRSIVFVSDRSGSQQIWRAAADGRDAVALTVMESASMGSPRWSPDGTRIAFDATSSRGRAIFLIDASGGPPRQWTKWSSCGRPSWSHDGRWIYYQDADSAGSPQIFKISALNDGNSSRVTNDGGADPLESPDGRYLYYTHGAELRRIPVEGGRPEKVFAGPLADGWWSITEAGVFFVDVLLPTYGSNEGTKPVFRLDPESGRVEEVARIEGEINRPTPDFSVARDGRSILYSRFEIAISQVRMLELRPQ